MALFLAAITLGLLGSFHCIGMCGPIALALPVHRYSPVLKYTGIALYNLGRMLTYTLLGMLFGLLGQSFFIGGFQQAVSVSIGVLLILWLVLPKLRWFQASRSGVLYAYLNRLQQSLAAMFHRKGLHVLFLTGMLNGLLPCGMVYLGIAGAAATGSYLQGAAFMFFFGLGTAPAMFAVAVLGQFVSLKFRKLINKAMPITVSLMAVLLIIRGLNLGIPYLSPEFEKQDHTISCCEKGAKEKPIIRCSPKKCH